MTPFTLAKKAILPKEKVEEFHRAVTKFVVKGLHSFSTVESPWFREMVTALNPRYRPPSRDELSNTLIPAWYNVEKQNVIQELAQVSKAAITCDGWTSVAQDHYLTVTVHYTSNGQIKQKVLNTKAVYESQTGLIVAEEIKSILEEFQINNKVVAATVDNASNMDVALKNMKLLKVGCFAHTLNLAAQKVYSISTITRWCAKLRAVVVWLKRSSMTKTVMREKQQLLNLPEHNMILDVRTRWNSLFLMVERFLEQYPAIQAASLDPRLRKPMEKDKLERLTDEDFQKAEDFIKVMKLLYTSTLCVSSEKSPTCGQILPILTKLKAHFTVAEEDTLFTSALKAKVWEDLEKRYQDEDIQNFLQEATLMDPRFKGKLECAADAAWGRLEKAAVCNLNVQMESLQNIDEEGSDDPDEKKAEEHSPSHKKRAKKSALEELFEDEDQELLQAMTTKKGALSKAEQVQKEIEIYRGLSSIPSGQDPVAWWWGKRDSLPILSALSNTYLCVQASSTPSERVFSCAGHAISQERCRILPEKANMVIFLQKNC